MLYNIVLCIWSQSLHLLFLHQIATEKALSLEEVREEASVILEEMSQKLQMGFIRLMAYMLSKVLKRIFTGIHVNTEGLNAVRNQPIQLCITHVVQPVCNVQLLSHIQIQHV